MKLDVRKTVGVIVFICSMATSGYALSTTRFSSWTIPLLIISFGLILLIKPCMSMDKRKLFSCILWLVIGGLSTLINYTGENLNAYLHMSLVVIIALLVSQRFPANDMIRMFLNFMRIITVVAIIMWVITDVLAINPPLPEIKNFNGAIYQTGIIWNRYRYSTFYSNRIIGFFWEPGLFATYLCICLSIEFLIKEYYKIKDVVLFIIAIILTQSSAGYLLLCLVLFLPALNYKGKWRNMLLLLLGVVTIIMAFFSDSIYSQIIGSSNPIIQKFDFSSGNGASRLLSLQANIAMLMERPFFGRGIAEANNVYASRMSFFGQAAQTSTTFFYTAAFGILGFTYTLFFIQSIMRLPKISEITWQSAFVLVVIVLNIINKEPHTLFLFTYIAMFYLIGLRGKATEQDNNSEEVRE